MRQSPKTLSAAGRGIVFGYFLVLLLAPHTSAAEPVLLARPDAFHTRESQLLALH
jgi:hypothetical protein